MKEKPQPTLRKTKRKKEIKKERKPTTMQPSTKPQEKDNNRKQSTFGMKEIDLKKPLTTLNS
jgi:hypothetical protein